MNYFAFETEVRGMMNDLVRPCLERQLEDREQVKELQLIFNKFSRRLQNMEAMFNMQRGRN
jgi:hypothetical protein